jgi:hypothetical protein
MVKLTYDYDSPENNAAVRLARAKLPAAIGNHLADKRDRALYREGYAVPKAFGIERDVMATPESGPSIVLRGGPVSLMDAWMEYVRTTTKLNRADTLPRLMAGLIDAAKPLEEPEVEDEPICNSCYIARELHGYMQFRAAREGVEHTLSEEFYRQAVHAGTVSIFGVTFDEKAGELTADAQNPEALEEWNSLCDAHREEARQRYLAATKAAA